MAELRERLEHRPLLLQLLPGGHHQPHQRRHRVLGVRPQLPTPGFSPAVAVLPAGAAALPVKSWPWKASPRLGWAWTWGVMCSQIGRVMASLHLFSFP